eukprot:3911041-Rhodomonas_salina.1
MLTHSTTTIAGSQVHSSCYPDNHRRANVGSDHEEQYDNELPRRIHVAGLDPDHVEQAESCCQGPGCSVDQSASLVDCWRRDVRL